MKAGRKRPQKKLNEEARENVVNQKMVDAKSYQYALQPDIPPKERDELQGENKRLQARLNEDDQRKEYRDDAEHKERCKDHRRRQDKGEVAVKSSLYRKQDASGTPLAFEAMDLKEALLPIATCYKELHSTKWSTCVKCWRAWFAGEAQQHGKAHREYQQESKILSKTALPVTKLAPIGEWEKQERQMYVRCNCGAEDVQPKEVDGKIVCGKCEKEDWSRQLVVCESCNLAFGMDRCVGHHEGMEYVVSKQCCNLAFGMNRCVGHHEGLEYEVSKQCVYVLV